MLYGIYNNEHRSGEYLPGLLGQSPLPLFASILAFASESKIIPAQSKQYDIRPHRSNKYMKGNSA
jgi:hypothetical protein